jgi:hypothetical protein
MALAYEGDNYRSKRSYITTAPFNSNRIYQYNTQLNPTNLRTEGRLVATSTLPSGVALSATNCPAGRILREVGRKLYPGANPGLALGDTYSGAVVGTTDTNKFWVMVYDAQTGLKGFIDPNAAIFTIYNSDKSVEIQDAFENAGGVPTRLGQPVNTAGNVTLGGQLALTGTTKAITYVVTTSPYAFGTAANLGPFYSFAAAAAVAITATSVPPTGTTLTIFYSGAFTTTPGSGFVGAAVAPTGTQCIAVSYVSNGTVLIEYARSGALPTVPTFP